MTSTDTAPSTRTTLVPVEEIPGEKQLMESYVGFVNDQESSAEERLVRLAGMAPVALQVMSESRDTVERLRGEVEAVKRQPLVTGSDYGKKISEAHHLTMVDLWRQWKAVRARVELTDFLDEVRDMFGAQFAQACFVFFGQRGAEETPRE